MTGDHRCSCVPTPVTVARRSAGFDDYRPVGIEGLVGKGAATPYLPGRRGWIKVKSRESRDIVVGAVIGTIQHPEVIIAGRYDSESQLIIVGRSTPLTPAQSQELGRLLRSPS